MSHFIDLTGQKFGRWNVIRYSHHRGGKSIWVCQYDCGTVREVQGCHMRAGRSRSCGCLEHELLMERNTTHGKNKTPLHYLWLGVKDRCYNKNDKAYKNYGGRGITVCDEWRTNFLAFESWALKNGYQKGLTLDRIDNEKGYSPDNCRFADRITQANNKRSNHRLTVNGRTQTVMQWAKEMGLNESVIRNRLKRGWSEHDAVMIPVRTFTRAHDYKTNRDSLEVVENSQSA